MSESHLKTDDDPTATLTPATSSEDISSPKKKRFSKLKGLNLPSLARSSPGTPRNRAHTMGDAQAALRAARRRSASNGDSSSPPTSPQQQLDLADEPRQALAADAEDFAKSPSGESKRLTHRISKAFKQLLPARDDSHFHNIFKNIPEDEHLVDDFMCALQRDILVQGRLYVSPSYFAFYSNILGWETILTINCKDIVAIRKEKTALVIPNAIQIVTVDSKYNFASFLSRDSAFRCLFKLWQNALMEEPLAVDELMGGTSRDYRGGTGRLNDDDSSSEDNPSSPVERAAALRSQSTSLLVPANRFGRAASADSNSSTGSRLSATLSSSSMEEASRSAGAAAGAGTTSTADTAGTAGASPRGGSTASSSRPSGKTTPVSAATASATSPSPVAETPQVVSCDCLPAQHEQGKTFVEASIPADVDTVFKLLFTSNSWFKDLYAARETTNLKSSDWSASHPGVQQDPEGRTNVSYREMSYSLKLNYSIGPKRAHASEKQWCQMEAGARYLVLTDVQTPNVPFGENFWTLSRYCITRNGNNTHLRISSHMRYRKSPPWSITRTMIEKNGYSGLKEYWEHVLASLTEYCEQQDPGVPEVIAPAAEAVAGHESDTSVGSVHLSRPVSRTTSIRSTMSAKSAKSEHAQATGAAPRPAWLGDLLSPQWFIVVMLLLLNLILLLRVWSVENQLVLQHGSPTTWLQHRVDCQDDVSCRLMVEQFSRNAFDQTEMLAHASMAASKLADAALSMQRMLTLLATNSTPT
eukprot:m.484333 g.484333  ORF g.484333 m.484333 type:complete len:755 (+) comp23310_c0_seq1:92-2356(+)